MEGSKHAAGSSLVSELFGRKDSSAKSSSSPGVFSAVFPPASSVAGKDSSPSRPNSSSNRGVLADHGASKGKGSKGRGGLQQNRDKCSGGKMDPCFLSSSVYYGGQDFCSQNTTSNKHYDYKDGQHDSDPIDSRGDWWQGSLYY